MRFHLSEIRSSAYCERQAYYSMQDDSRVETSPETDVLRQVAYLYTEFLESPKEALSTAVSLADADADEVGIDADGVRRGLERTRGTDAWAVAEPDYHEKYIESGRVCGTLDKVVETRDGYAASVINTGTPPKNGVWSSERVEAAAVMRLLEAEFGSADCVYVEYPRKGDVREVGINKRDERRLEKTLESLESASKGHPPSRTSNRSKCKTCDYRQDCGVRTESLLTRLRSRLR